MNQNIVNEKASKFLGKQLNDYKTSYNPELLVPIERDLNRKDYKITNNDFVGFDIWHNYECSFMTKKGYPVSLVGKIKIPSNSKYFIESKSMKLYFFSFHMEKLGETVDESIKIFKERVRKDLSYFTNSDVKFEVFNKKHNINTFENFKNIDELIDIEKIEFKEFKESPDLMVKGDLDEYKVIIKNVRSNCRVTHQPDFANLYIHIKGETPTLESLLKYIVSFRNEYHFHEEVTEQIFKNIKEKFKVKDLMVANLFTRRGGIDICPVRTTNLDLVDENFINIDVLPERTIFQ